MQSDKMAAASANPESRLRAAAPDALSSEGGHGEAGLTLVEIVVALAILAMTVAMVTGSGVQLAERWGEQDRVQSVKRQVATFRREAFLTGSTIVWGAAPPPGLALPPGWSAPAAPPIAFLPSGICTDGRITIMASSGRTYALNLTSPDCDPFLESRSAP
jgi:type II secretory pathway pseudopilin PulG